MYISCASKGRRPPCDIKEVVNSHHITILSGVRSLLNRPLRALRDKEESLRSSHGVLMAEQDPATETHPLSPLDHVMPRHHVPKLLYFATDATADAITTTLHIGLAKTLAAMPVLSGSIGPATHARQKGTMTIQGPYYTADDILTTEDLSDVYDYEELRAKHFPTDMLAPEHITPDLAGKPRQVMLAQANFLRGGLLLFFAVHHCVMDEVGLFNTLKVWSTFCRGDDGSLLVQPEWLDREPLMNGAGGGRLEDHPTYKLLGDKETEAIANGSAKLPEYFAASSDAGTAIFFISDRSLEALKRAATQEGSQVSTNDALCAFVWRHITAARRTRSADDHGETLSNFNMTVNARSRCSPPISPCYCGNAVAISKARAPLSKLLSRDPSDIAETAVLIRNSVLAVGDAYIKDVIQMIRSIPDIGRLAPQAPHTDEEYVGCSSWAKQPYYSLDWGDVVGGTCQRVRWRRIRTDGVFVIFPHIDPTTPGSASKEGGLEICLGLRQEHLQRLRDIEEFREFAQWRCG